MGMSTCVTSVATKLLPLIFGAKLWQISSHMRQWFRANFGSKTKVNAKIQCHQFEIQSLIQYVRDFWLVISEFWYESIKDTKIKLNQTLILFLKN